MFSFRVRRRWRTVPFYFSFRSLNVLFCLNETRLNIITMSTKISPINTMSVASGMCAPPSIPFERCLLTVDEMKRSKVEMVFNERS